MTEHATIAGLRVERDVPCTLRDGVTLYADVYRPPEPGPHPVLLMRTPYDKTVGESNAGYSHPSWFARHGYVVVIQDCRGRYRSEGDFYPIADEADDGAAAVEWARDLEGSDGRVVMYGFSYNGATQLLAATRRPRGLVAICPGFTGSQYFDGWAYNQGAFALAFNASWAAFLAIDTARRRRDGAAVAALGAAMNDAPRQYWALPLADHPALPAHGDAPYYRDWLAHPTYDAYWKRWSIDEDYSRIDVPALHVGGWYDVFLSGTVENFVRLQREAGSEAARATQKLIIGPWHHMPWAPVAGSAPGTPGHMAVDDCTIEWLGQVLAGDAAAAGDPPVRLYILDDGWRDFSAWPPPEATPTDYYLHSGGRANTCNGDGVLSTTAPAEEIPDVFTYDPLQPVMSAGGHSCCVESITPMGPASQLVAESSNNVLVYTTAPFDHDVTLAGEVVVTLHAASTALDTDFTARLCIVGDCGCSTNLQEGIVRARYRDSLERPELLEPGRAYEYRIVLGPVGTRVAAGSRLRLDVSSSDFPQWDRNLNTGGPLGQEGPGDAVVATQTVLHDAHHPSRITLPLIA